MKKKIVLRVGDSRLTVLGSGLRLSAVSVEDGEATVEGFIDSCAYSGAGKGSIWGRLVK